ncbi:cyclodeaminase/cyclohydrolase family protein [Methylocystis sp. MJC1]|jgi:formiminotetrahydrofolate cyclodeaminase|uniref:methenyltetrahydrofolate cyclohydrolase n=1 Tax=Methylocystis sp. MJC1 TaxID=2654282 RepID=UPI0013EBC023|nr:methenyltetrahydrofolate cyclohydrolase [Methylocystis sp. MJC1]KAF2989163.1 Methenyltetrahydrofolate cyclohydrolase [Methylocystis sp. MJC1]MBU6525882.1 cyclodeaminase/cyclohydrolase family protein [Methylocystis sp. MJC1]UZX12349.1 cyclodeaminase/cyclohydrolase family protein [Methylocystis sp. MJC1]
MSAKTETIGKFLDELASSAPTPGGGGAAALSGAMGAALVSMVCNLTIGKKNYEAVSEDLKKTLARAEALREELTKGIDEDVVAFNTLMGAYGLPKATDEEKAARTAAIQEALKVATLAPLATCKVCYEVIALSKEAADKGNLGVISDAGVAVLAANAGLRSCALNVFINAKSIKDRDFAETQLAEVNALLAKAAAETEAVYEVVRGKIG